MRAALDHGGPTLLTEVESIADGLLPVITGELTYEHVSQLMDDVVTVSDDAIREAARLLIHRQKLVVEFSGAATTAALLEGKVDVEGARIAAVISGGNMEPAALAELA
jgi:threonine dehydratase